MPDHKPTPQPLLHSFGDEQQTEALFASIGDGAISTDEFGRITRVNPVARRLLGYSKAELVGSWFPKNIIAVTAEDMPVNLIDRPITQAFLTGQPVSDKTYYRRKKGAILPVAVTASPIIMDGRPLGAIEVFRDITLEQEVDRMKSEFISLASHQLRTPLSAIKTYSHMLTDGLMGSLNDDQKQAMQTILNATNRMNELISTLLNITRIESGTIAVSFKGLNVLSLIEELMPELSLMAHAKSTKLELERKGKDRASATSDALIIKEVVTNLVSNAIKYTADGGEVTITVETRKSDILVSVRDCGWGIPKVAQEQIFSKFFRAGNIVKRETTGTGLGLYLVKGLLDAIGGDIWFKSKEGAGTTFYFTVPRQPTKLVQDV